mgnify:CR=1 FL=1
MRVKKYANGGAADNAKKNQPDIKELLSVMDKMSSSPRTDRRATFEDGTSEEVHPSSIDAVVKGIMHKRSDQDKADLELNARDFLQKWMNSKKGMEMLKNSYADSDESWENAFVNRHRNTQQAHVAVVPNFYEARRNAETNEIEYVKDGAYNKMGDQSNLGGTGNTVESKGRPYVMGPQALRDRGIARLRSPTPNSKIAVHELSHSSDSNFDVNALNRYIPKSDTEQMRNFSQDRDSGSDRGKYSQYISRPTETRARLQSIRALMEDQGYDVFNKEITSDMLNKSYSNRDSNIKNESFYTELRKAYSDEEILKLLNTVS